MADEAIRVSQTICTAFKRQLNVLAESKRTYNSSMECDPNQTDVTESGCRTEFLRGGINGQSFSIESESKETRRTFSD